MATKIKGLQQWCRKMTDGYPLVDITNFTSSWRDGMAFCAIIHRFRPDLIDYDSLSPENVFENNKLAFEVGESELNIPAFLEADDMARLKVPDKLSVITYVSQYYNYLHQLPQLGGPGVKGAVKKGTSAGIKRPSDNANVLSEPSNKKTTVSSNEDTKNTTSSSSSPRKGTVGDKCQICQNKVYLLERHMEGGKLYHRSCFRHSELSPTNKVYTKSPFMSPALSNEKATLEKSHRGHGARDTVETLSNDKHEDSNNKKGTENSVLTGLRSGLKRVDVVGSKHPIQADKDKDENAKKAKVQPRAIFGGKENLNTEQKSEDLPFPLSGKEAKKLEKRRQEIISSESSTPVNKGAKRGVPLIFQNKDTSNSSSSHTNTPSKTLSSPLSSSLSSTVGKKDDKEVTSGLSNSNSNKSSISVDLKPADSKSAIGGKNYKTDIQVLQRKFSGQTEYSNESNSISANITQPVARHRVAGSKVASSPFMDNSSVKKDNSDPVSVTVRNKETFPKAAPRKSLFEMKEHEVDRDRVKNSSTVSHSSAKSSSSEGNTPRSSHGVSPASSPPPALPLLPPPSHPCSKPPPLPTSSFPSRPPPLPTSSPPSRPKLPSHSSTNKSSQPNESSSKGTKSTNQTTVKDKKDLHEPSTQQPKHQLSSSSSTSSSSSSSSKPARPSVGPTPKQQQPVATLVTTTERKGDGTVLNSLLASLAGVRGRSASTPGILADTPTTSTTNNSAIPQTTTASSSPSPNITSKRKHSEPAIKLSSGNTTSSVGDRLVNKPSSSVTPVKITLNPTPVSLNQSSQNAPPESVNILNSLKHVSQTIPSKSDSGRSAAGEPLKGGDNQQSKSKSGNTNDQRKVGDLVKNYLSKSKEDLSSRGNTNTTNNVESKSEDIFKKPLKPVQAKDFNKDAKKSETSSSAVAKMSSRENLTHVKDVNLKPVPSLSKPQDFQGCGTNTVGAKLNKASTPMKQLEEISKSTPLSAHKENNKGRESSAESDVSKSDSEMPQWKKDIEERKRKLREDIVKSETPTKRSDRYDKEKLKSQNDTVSNQSLRSDESLPSLPKKSSPQSVPDSPSKEDKLNWQKEAERRMAAFAMFDSEDESKCLDEDSKVEEKLQEVRSKNHEGKRDVVEKSDLKTRLKEVEASRHKVVLKPVNIDISINKTGNEESGITTGNKGKTVELSKPISINNSNNTFVSQPEDKKRGEVTISQSKTKAKDDGKTLGVKDLDKPKQSSPKIKRKITVLGQKNQEESPAPPSNLSLTDKKKKIVVTGQFDFDDTSPSDFESSLTRSTEQLSISDTQTPSRPPRTKSLRSREESPKQISAIELQQQLLEIDNRLTDLELRGRDLEDSIRNASLQEEEEDEDDHLMKEWFQLVSEKNDLVRQEAELVYVSREQDLQDEQEQLDSQLRYLMKKEELTMSPQEKEEEAYLLQRKLDIVNQRSYIIDSMDEDRLRYEEEDRGIEDMLKSKGLWKDDGTLLAEKGKKVANAIFYA